MTSSYEGGTTRNTLRALQALAYTRRNAPDPGRGFEGTRALMEKKNLDVQVQIRFASWNVGTLPETSGKITETSRASH